MEDDDLKDEVLFNLLERYNKLGWNPEGLKSQYREVKMFIYTHGIVEGSVTIPADLVYYSYHKTKGESAISRNRFTYLFKHFFVSIKATGRTAFKLNPEPLGLPKEYSFYKDPRFWHLRKRVSKYKGVSAAPYGEWMAELEIEDNKYLVGYFGTSRDAAMAWNQAARYYFGEGAPQNKIKYGKKRRKKKIKFKKGTLARIKRKASG